MYRAGHVQSKVALRKTNQRLPNSLWPNYAFSKSRKNIINLYKISNSASKFITTEIPKGLGKRFEAGRNLYHKSYYNGFRKQSICVV